MVGSRWARERERERAKDAEQEKDESNRRVPRRACLLARRASLARRARSCRRHSPEICQKTFRPFCIFAFFVFFLSPLGPRCFVEFLAEPFILQVFGFVLDFFFNPGFWRFCLFLPSCFSWFLAAPASPPFGVNPLFCRRFASLGFFF